jgi:hypothetical protein
MSEVVQNGVSDLMNVICRGFYTSHGLLQQWIDVFEILNTFSCGLLKPRRAWSGSLLDSIVDVDLHCTRMKIVSHTKSSNAYLPSNTRKARDGT